MNPATHQIKHRALPSSMGKYNNISSTAGWEIVTIQNFEGIETIRPMWEEMQRNQSSPHPNADIDRYLSTLRPIKDTVQPYIMLVLRNGHPEAMLLGQKGSTRIRCEIGYLTLLKPSLLCISICYSGLLGQVKSEVCSILIEELYRRLRTAESDVVVFNHLSTDSEMYKLARTKPSVLSRGYCPKIDPHWSMPVPKDIELFYQSCRPKSRNTLLRKIKKLERAYPNQIRIVTYNREDELEEGFSVASKISQRTYQHALGAGLLDNSQTRGMMATAARHGWLRLHILFINDKPCAFQGGLQYGKTYFLGQLGLDPEWRKWNAGTVLFMRVLEELCRNPSVELFDFGFGNAQYKHSYGNKQWAEASVYMFAPRFYPILINLLRAFTMGLSVSIEHVLKKGGFSDWIKRRWRNLLQSSYNH